MTRKTVEQYSQSEFDKDPEAGERTFSGFRSARLKHGLQSIGINAGELVKIEFFDLIRTRPGNKKPYFRVWHGGAGFTVAVDRSLGLHAADLLQEFSTMTVAARSGAAVADADANLEEAGLPSYSRLVGLLRMATRHIPSGAMEYSQGDHGERVYPRDQIGAALQDIPQPEAAGQGQDCQYDRVNPCDIRDGATSIPTM